jgi:hypothetical protein
MHGPVAAVAGANLDDRLVDESALHDSSGFDADELSPLFLVEQHLALGTGEQGIILSPADIESGVKLGSALADQDLSGFDVLSAESFHTQSLGSGISAVSRAALSLFMRHCYSFPSIT